VLNKPRSVAHVIQNDSSFTVILWTLLWHSCRCLVVCAHTAFSVNSPCYCHLLYCRATNHHDACLPSSDLTSHHSEALQLGCR